MGGNNPARAALMAGAIAMRFMNDEITVKEVPSHLQCPTCDYSSSFSRAVEISNPDYRRLFVSGTASIDPSGKTAHVGDVDAQISLTLEIVEAILKFCGKSVCWRFISLLRRNEQHVKIICQKEEAQQKKKTFTIWSNCEKTDAYRNIGLFKTVTQDSDPPLVYYHHRHFIHNRRTKVIYKRIGRIEGRLSL